MKMPIAITMAMLVIITAVGGTTITDMRWNANQKVIEILFDDFPANWGGWTMYVDGREWPMEGGSGNAIVRPNAPVVQATGLFVGTDPWLSSLSGTNFPCCGAIQFSIPGQGRTNIFQYNLIQQGCKTNSPKACGASGSQSVGNLPGDQNPPWPSGMTREENTDRPCSSGQNYKMHYMTTADPRLCAEYCANDNMCDAFTYVRPGARGVNSQAECWLKGPGVPTRLPSTCCISGRKESALITGGLGNPNYDPIALEGEVFYIPQAGASSLPNFDDLIFNRLIYTKFLNMIPQSSSIGFQDVGRSEWFAVRYGGKFEVKTAGPYKAGTYRFRLASDDGSRLLIDGNTIIDNDGLHSIQSRSREVNLDYGVHDIEVEYFQGTGTAALGLFVILPESTKETLFMPEYGAISRYSLGEKTDRITKWFSFSSAPPKEGATVIIFGKDGIYSTPCDVELDVIDLKENPIEYSYIISKTGYQDCSGTISEGSGSNVHCDFKSMHA